MRIAVTSQNLKTITGHAGKTRKFILYAVEADGSPVEVERLRLPKEMSFHEFQGEGPHPIDGVDVLITAGCGANFTRKLAARGIEVVTTGETDPFAAVDAYVHGRPLAPAAPHDEHECRHATSRTVAGPH